MNNKILKDLLIIKEGDVVKVSPLFNVYNQKSYTVLEVYGTELICRVEGKNILGHTQCVIYKDELADEMIEKFSYRNQ